MENNDNQEQKTINITGTHNKYKLAKMCVKLHLVNFYHSFYYQ